MMMFCFHAESSPADHFGVLACALAVIVLAGSLVANAQLMDLRVQSHHLRVQSHHRPRLRHLDLLTPDSSEPERLERHFTYTTADMWPISATILRLRCVLAARAVRFTALMVRRWLKVRLGSGTGSIARVY